MVAARTFSVSVLLALSAGWGGSAWAAPPWELLGPWASSATEEAGGADDAPALAEGREVRVLRLSAPMGEASNPWDPFGLDDRIVLSELLQALDRAADAPEVGTVVLQVRSSELGLAQARGIAQAVRGVRDRGKRVIAHLVEATTPTLLFATAADEVLMTPEGTVVAPGLRVEVTFLEDLLDTVGIEADIETMGRYKSAAEPLTRTTMSEAAREALEAVLDGVWETLVGDLARHRGLEPDKIRALLDLGMMCAEDARKHGLIDDLVYWPDLLERLEEDAGVPPKLAFPERVELPDPSSLMGLVKLLTRSPGDDGGEAPRIALLAAEGPVVMGRAGDSLWSGEGVIAAADMLDAIEAIREDDSVRAVVLRVDSPGGSALASDLIWRALRELARERPVIASLGDTAASGGYYIASAARHIVAEPNTITGSIGVFGGKLVLKGLHDDLDLHTVVLSRGKHAGLFSPHGRFSDSERRVVRRMMKRTYDTFVNRVARGREMSYDAVDRVAQGRVWCGRDARDRGLVDTLGGLGVAIAHAERMAGLDPGEAQLRHYPKKKSLMEMLRSRSGTLRAPGIDVKALVGALPGGLGRELLETASLLHRLMSGEHTLALMPVRVRLR